MDETDIKILEILKKNSRTKYVRVGEIVGLTEGAVRIRVKKMLKEGVITRFTVETSAEVEGIVLVKTDPAETWEAVRRIKEVSERVFELSGDYDVAALIQSYTIEELNRKVDSIRGFPGVLDTKTLVKLVGR